jgi:hypothetical protein
MITMKRTTLHYFGDEADPCRPEPTTAPRRRRGRRAPAIARGLRATFWWCMAAVTILTLPVWACVPVLVLDAVLFIDAVWSD